MRLTSSMPRILTELRRRPDRWFTFRELRALTGLPETTLRSNLCRLVKRGRIAQSKRPVWRQCGSVTRLFNVNAWKRMADG